MYKLLSTNKVISTILINLIFSEDAICKNNVIIYIEIILNKIWGAKLKARINARRVKI